MTKALMAQFQKRVYPVRKFKRDGDVNTRNVSAFSNGVYGVVKRISWGQILTYKQVAEKIGAPLAARAVGNALNKNRDKNVPCHRVVRSDGKIGGYVFGAAKKAEILKKEGAKIKNGIIQK